jgi:hypothetical protein
MNILKATPSTGAAVAADWTAGESVAIEIGVAVHRAPEFMLRLAIMPIPEGGERAFRFTS